MPSRHYYHVSSRDRIRTRTYILNDVTVVTNKKERPSLRHIDLHPDEPVRVPRQVVQRDALTEIHRLVVECFPVPVLN